MIRRAGAELETELVTRGKKDDARADEHILVTIKDILLMI